jgi:hypothetical protein
MLQRLDLKKNSHKKKKKRQFYQRQDTSEVDVHCRGGKPFGQRALLMNLRSAPHSGFVAAALLRPYLCVCVTIWHTVPFKFKTQHFFLVVHNPRITVRYRPLKKLKQPVMYRNL